LAYRLNKGHTEVYLIKQLGVLFAGLVIIYFCHKVNYTVYSNIALLLFAISIPLLIFTFFMALHSMKAHDGFDYHWWVLPFKHPI
jgi:cell division protein FtsW